MKKKIIVSSIFFFSIVLLCLLTISFDKNLNEHFINDSDYKQIISTRKLNNNIDVDISFDDYKLIKDNDNNLYYSLIEESSTAYNPKVSINSSKYNISMSGGGSYQ